MNAFVETGTTEADSVKGLLSVMRVHLRLI